MKYLFGLILFASLFYQSRAQGSFGFEMSEGVAYTEIDFKKVSNLIIVPIRFNGQGPFNFILDTGSESGLVFDKRVVREENYLIDKRIPIYGADGSAVTSAMIASDLSLSLSNEQIRGSKQSMLVLEEDYTDIKNVLGVQTMGILGSEIFNRFIVEVDYDLERIILYDPEKFKKPKGFRKIPITVENFRPFLKTTLKQANGRRLEVKLLIDTGASSALFLDAERNNDILLPRKTLNHSLGKGLTGEINGKIGRVKKLSIANRYHFKNIITSYPENWRALEKPSASQAAGSVRYGTIGGDLLSKFRIIFDYLNECIYVRKAEEYFDNFQFNNGGLNFIAFGEDLNQFLVSSIIEGSAAERAGFQEGDEIIAINSKPAQFYTLTEINGIFRSKPGTRLKIIIRRDGELIEKKLRLRKLI